MAGIDRVYTKHYDDKSDLVIWCVIHKPSLLKDIFYPFNKYDDFKESQKYYAKAKGMKIIPENEEMISDIKVAIASFNSKQDRYLYWHCPLEFIREYLETQCGYKKANWFVKLFWKY